MIAPAALALALCGDVRTVGSSGDFSVILTEADRAIGLTGRMAGELIGYAGRVCVNGSLDRVPRPGTSQSITVAAYRLVGDGKHAPIVGTIRKIGASYYVETPQRRRLRVVAKDGTTLDSVLDHLVWLTASWSDGALQLIRIGPLGRS